MIKKFKAYLASLSPRIWASISGVALGAGLVIFGSIFGDKTEEIKAATGESGPSVEASGNPIVWFGFGIAFVAGAGFIGSARKKIKGE